MCRQLYLITSVFLLWVPLHNSFEVKIAKNDLNWRIIGGNDAPDGLFTYQVSLRIKNSALRSTNEADCNYNFKGLASKVMYHYGYHTCGGSIISSEYVLTAAHCVSYKKPEMFLAVVGTTTLNTGGHAHAVTEIHWNTDFSLFHGKHDIALVKVSPPFDFSLSGVDTITLEEGEVFPQEKVVLTGWGFLDRLDVLVSNNLQQVRLETMEISECNSKHDVTVTQDQVCTTTQLGQGACKGDSGGPLVKIYSPHFIKQIGIVSYNDACQQGSPDVYTKPGNYLSWIRENCNNCI